MPAGEHEHEQVLDRVAYGSIGECGLNIVDLHRQAGEP